MSQAFATTYDKFFRWPKIEKNQILRPVDRLAEELPEGDIWRIQKHIGEDDGEGGESLAEAVASIKKMYRKRVWSVYQVDYCRNMIPKDSAKSKFNVSDNAVLNYGNALYGPRVQKIPPPLPSSRRVYGYLRPTNMYFPLTTYQVLHGKVGYDVLIANAEPKKAPETVA